MKVLFVCSGNNKENGAGMVVKNQGETLVQQGVQVDFFLIKGRGAFGYLQNIPRFFSVLRKNKYDVVHAHYGDSAYLATLGLARPLVVSLMGSDALGKGATKYLLFLFARFWDAVIVKSQDMKRRSGLKQPMIIPNGVDLDKFGFIDNKQAKQTLGWSTDQQHVVFMADPSRPEKNFALAEKAFQLVKNPNVKLKIIFGVPHKDTALYFYAADVILMTSLHEGSPNVIKEAMACNCPIVCTDVGDVREVVSGTEGCFVTNYDPGVIAGSLTKALQFGKRTAGRQRLMDLSLDAVSVANKIISIYKKVRR